MPPLRRARQPWQKEDRRRGILSCAARMFDEGHPGALTMASLAKESGLAKGTLYLYFKTKEEVFLGVLQDELEDWLDAVDLSLSEMPSDARSEIAIALAEALLTRGRLLRLFSMLTGVIEPNCDEEAVDAFRQVMDHRLEWTGSQIEGKLRLPEGHGPVVLRRAIGAGIGIWMLTALRTTPGPSLQGEVVVAIHALLGAG